MLTILALTELVPSRGLAPLLDPPSQEICGEIGKPVLSPYVGAEAGEREWGVTPVGGDSAVLGGV